MLNLIYFYYLIYYQYMIQRVLCVCIKNNVLLLKIVIMDYRMQTVHVSLGPWPGVCVFVSCVGGGGVLTPVTRWGEGGGGFNTNPVLGEDISDLYANCDCSYI